MSELQLTIRRILPAPRERVFKAWTDPKELWKWWGGIGYTTSVVEIDFRVGGKYRLGIMPKKNEEHICGGEFREIVPPSKLVYTWSWESGESTAKNMVVTVEFMERGNMTEVVLHHSGFADNADQDRHNKGWNGVIDHLEQVLKEDSPRVVVEKFIQATPERIWRALSIGSEVEKWFFTTVETNPKPFGSYKMKWESLKDGKHNHNRWGEYLEFVPNQELSFEWRGLGRENKSGHAFDPTDEHLTIFTITLTPEANGTRIKLVHSGWGTTPEWEASRKGHSEGWTFYLDNLESVLLSGRDLRIEEGHQRVKSA